MNNASMLIVLRVGVSMLALSVLGFDPIKGAENVPPLTTIIREVIARDDATQVALHSLQYHQVLNSEQLDKNDKVTKHQEVQMIVRPGATNEIQVVSEKGDDLPENPDEATLQAQGQKAQKQKVNFPLKDIVNRFNIALVGTGTVQNQSVYILFVRAQARSELSKSNRARVEPPSRTHTGQHPRLHDPSN